MRAYKGIILVAAAALLLPACATKKYVDEQATSNSDKIGSVESAVEANQARISELDGEVDAAAMAAGNAQKTGDQAMAKGNQAMKSAEEAKAMAEGKLVLKVTVTDDVGAFSSNKWMLSDDAITGAESTIT